MKAAIIVFIGFTLLVVFALCKINSKISREEEQREIERLLDERRNEQKEES